MFSASRFQCQLPIGIAIVAAALCLSGCKSTPRDPATVVFLIESSPTSLDPRVGTDAQSEHIDELLFDGLVDRDRSFRFVPALAQSWEQPDPLTLVFHLRPNVQFHDGRTLTARDVAYTIESLRNGTVVSPRGATYASVRSIEARDDRTVIFHLATPDNFLLTNLSTGAIGIIPTGAGRDFWQHPVGTGPFRFVSQQMDQDVVVERNPASWRGAPQLPRIRFRVVPDAVTAALELEKGSADLAVNSLPVDVLPVLASRPHLALESVAGTPVQYLAFNTRDPQLKDKRVRQAISCAIDKSALIDSLQRGHARPATSLLPPAHWAFADDGPRYEFDPARAASLLDAAGYKPDAGGIRLRLTMKTSSVEDARLIGAVLQQQLGRVGIALDLRSYEFATFYSDVVHGAFQMYSLRWIGGNEQPDIFSYVFSSRRFPPKGANRGFYANPHLDALLDQAASSPDQNLRKIDYAEAQRVLAEDLPAINLWYRDTIVVHNRRLTNVTPAPSGSFYFLVDAALAPN